VVLHELIAMRPMREPKRDLAMLREAASGVVPRFDALGIDVAEPAAEVVYRALDVKPEARFSDAAAFTAAIEEVQARLSWAWGPAHTAALLGELFPSEIAQEQDTHRKTQTTAAVANRPPSRLRPFLLPVAGAALMFAAGAVLAMRETPGPPPPVVIIPPPPVAVVPTAPIRIPVTSSPEGATVIVNGERKGQTPLELALPPGGEAAISVEKTGFKSFHKTVALTGTPAPIHAELPGVPVVTTKKPVSSAPVARTPAHLSLFSKPWGKVIIDGKDTGEFTPLTNLTIAPGKHTFKIVNDELRLATTFSLDIAPGATVKESRPLVPMSR
jgi:hypothetical protein